MIPSIAVCFNDQMGSFLGHRLRDDIYGVCSHEHFNGELSVENLTYKAYI